MNKAFTFVELIIVIAIIGILAAAGVGSYATSRQTARDGKRQTDMTSVAGFLELHRVETGGYPSSGATWDGLLTTIDMVQTEKTVPPRDADTYCYYNDAVNDEYILRATGIERNVDSPYVGLMTGFTAVIGVDGTGTDVSTCPIIPPTCDTLDTGAYCLHGQ